jgi:hypothetical protein
MLDEFRRVFPLADELKIKLVGFGVVLVEEEDGFGSEKVDVGNLGCLSKE